MQAESSTGTLPGLSTQTKLDKPCRYYLRSGRCRRGAKCLFSHDETRRPVQPVDAAPSATDAGPSSSRLSAQASAFEPDSSSRSTLSASATDFLPTAQNDSDDDDAWQDIPSEPSAKAPRPRSNLKGVPASVTSNTLPCSICMELPTVYAQHPNCDHHFCPPCLNRWRRQHTQAKNKDCPVCRTASRFTFVTPQPFTGAARTLALARFRERAAQTPCKNFEKSLASRKGKEPFCMFGDECMYKHEVKGKEFKFGSGRVRINRGAKGRKRVARTTTGSRRSIGAEFFARIRDMDERVRIFRSSRSLTSGMGSQLTLLRG
ncbi:Zinc finger, CCCH-type [Kalmanozyma brasiliensis GHG001]|uniref:Zinc finger, CCCH-type n=1 Tax=Kalmanozyma brasiliensis (strain GHG001) TaxID=1365824 RepID=UPI002868156C|nr:Zinc finger, CCCH-type [Kalmanozyma brasiliensis GHG001]KAF6767369.1 Zinc finger, CCCH-type [Kalmanozyma brasiliensis GHG001]